MNDAAYLIRRGRVEVEKRGGSRQAPPAKRRPPSEPDDPDLETCARAGRAAGIYGVAAIPRAEPLSARRIDQLTRLVRRTYRLLYPGKEIPVSSARALIHEAVASADDEYGEREALDWAGGYQFPPDIAARDSTGLSDAGSLPEYVRQHHSTMHRQHALSPWCHQMTLIMNACWSSSLAFLSMCPQISFPTARHHHYAISTCAWRLPSTN